MAASGSVFSNTLKEITNSKLTELSKRRAAFESEKTKLLAAVQGEPDPIKRLNWLSNGVKRTLGIYVDKDGKVAKGWSKHPALEIELKNLDRFISQAQYDPSFSPNTLQSWEQSLLQHLETQSLKFSYASLYGQLVTEWLSGGKEDAASDEDIDMKEEYETVDSAKKLEARMEWEKFVFEPAKVDTANLQAYLDELFGVFDEQKKSSLKGLNRLREDVAGFERGLATPQQFTSDSLRWVIQGLITSDLLSDEKREVLKDFMGNDTILAEIADVLNMRMTSLESWSWGSGVAMEQRRMITGAFNILMHEDLLHAIFLQYIGVKISTFLKRAFTFFRRESGAWTPVLEKMSAAKQTRLGHYLGMLSTEPSVQVLRRREYRQNYFMAALQDHEQQRVEGSQGDEEADYKEFSQAPSAKRKRDGTQMQMQMRQQMQMQQMAMQQQPPRMMTASSGNPVPAGRPNNQAMAIMRNRMYPQHDETDDEGDALPKKPMEAKRRLLHLLSTEIAINTHTKGELTAFRSTFSSWNPLLPHETIFTVLEFLGFSQKWLCFFRTFLEAPLKFLDDDASAVPRTRRRGTPAAHVLSDVFGEAVLFCLDYSINQVTSGKLLWRLRDDFWFWSPEHELCVKAWKAVERFAEVTGTSIDLGKSGSARIVAKGKDPAQGLDPALPQGQIRWGFLYLSTETGRFVIDQKMVDAHIVELRKQLQDGKKSVFEFIQTWNTYADTFFTSNFGKPANCFGRDHMDEMLRTHERIQREIFAAWDSSGENGQPATSIVAYLKRTLRERFGVEGAPDGYLFFPADLGGLGLRSPFISLLQTRGTVLRSSKPLFDVMDVSERDYYERARTAFQNGAVNRVPVPRVNADGSAWGTEAEKDREAFISFEELEQHREEINFGTSENLATVWQELMAEPAAEAVELDCAGVTTALHALPAPSGSGNIHKQWKTMTPYWKWVAMMYGPEVVRQFGGLSIVDPGLLPMGMVNFFREKRVKWQA